MNLIQIKLALWQSRGSGSRMGLLILCIALGVSAQVAISSFVGQMNRTLSNEAQNLLTADLEISKRTPLTDQEKIQLKDALPPNSKVQEMISFVTMAAAVSNSSTRLVELRAVGADYPFYGGAEVRESNVTVDSLHKLNDALPIAYVQPEVQAQMDLPEGESIRIGRMEFKVAGTIIREPGLGAGIFSLGPRVFIGIRNLWKTRLIQSGSRATYSTMIALEDPEQAAIVAERLKKIWSIDTNPRKGFAQGLRDGDGIAIRSPKDKQVQMSRAFERLADYLRLVSLIALLLGGIGVGSVVQSFVQDHLESAAILRTLGATENQVARVFLIQAAGAGALGSVLGAAIGTAVQSVLPTFFINLFPLPLQPGADLRAILSGVCFGTLTSIYFSLLPVLRIKGLKPLSVFRNEPSESAPLAYRITALSGGALLLGASAVSESRSIPLGLLFSGSLIGSGLLIVLMAKWILPRLENLKTFRLGFGFRHGLSNLSRPQLKPQSAIVTLGLAALLLGFMTVYQFSLTQELRPGPHRNLPNLFVIDVQDDQMEDLHGFFSRENITDFYFSPMINARYRSRNGAAPIESKFASRESETNDYMRNREQNLSYRPTISADETITKGRWIDSNSKGPEISLEESFAKRLGANLGDQLSFDVQGVALQAKVTSLRKVRWASFKPNFFILISPWVLADAPKTWVGSIAGLSDDQKTRVQRELVKLFPNFTIFDVAEGGKRLLKILSSIYWSVRFVALFSILSGLVVLAGLALTTARQRQEEATLLKVLGAGARTIFASALTEFFFWGAISISIGMVLALALSWGILYWYLEMKFSVPWRELALVSSGMILLSTGIGLAFSRRIFFTKPMEILRQS